MSGAAPLPVDGQVAIGTWADGAMRLTSCNGVATGRFRGDIVEPARPSPHIRAAE